MNYLYDINDYRGNSEAYEEFYPENVFNNEENILIRKKTEADILKTAATSSIPLEFTHHNYNNNKESKTKPIQLGRKRKNSSTKVVHDKYSGDNIIRKIKSTLLTNIINYLNSIIFKAYDGNINHGLLIKQLKKMDQSQVKNVKDNKDFIYRKLKDIFSSCISGRYTNYLNDHNKNLINELLNNKDEGKRIKFENIFKLTFLDCLNHYSGKKNIKELEGLKSLDEECIKFEDDPDYVELFRQYVYDFEEIILRKKSRNRK